MNIRFTKMHGLGNDFVVIDTINQSVSLSTSQIQFLADRKRGVGCDQLLLVEAPDSSQFDFRYRIYNSDGGEVEQCGNGARCFGKFVRDKELTQKNRILVDTLAGTLILQLLDDGQVRVNMGVPMLEPDKVPFVAPKEQICYTLDVHGQNLEISVVSMGNPHAVLLVDDLADAPVAELGAAIENHGRFPNRVNVGFMQVLDQGHINLRVFERGVGETEACGSGACAAVVAGRLRNILQENVEVNLPGGKLMVSWVDRTEPVMMTGPATTVYEGSIEL